VANTVGAAGVGAQVLKVFGSDSLALASGILTLTILVVSEIIPKSLGASRWQTLAPFAAVSIRVLMVIAFPLVVLSEHLSAFLGHGKPKKMNREEILATAELGESDGTLRSKETLIIRNLLMLNNIYVVDIMTPRNVTLALAETMTVGDVLRDFPKLQFSRIPIYKGSMDHIIGIVHRYKILEASSQDREDTVISSLVSPVQSITENTSVSKALDMFIKLKAHIFYVVDNFGVTTGIVSLEDAIETLLGVEIVDEFDSVEDMRQYALEQWNRLKRK
jgi:CBS domain containing-hemolysin-like protein